MTELPANHGIGGSWVRDPASGAVYPADSTQAQALLRPVASYDPPPEAVPEEAPANDAGAKSAADSGVKDSKRSKK